MPVKVINEKYREVLRQRETEYMIKAGDTLTVKFHNLEPELNQTLTVRPDGRTDPFFMDDALVAGKTIPQFESEVKRYYAQQVNPTDMSVQVTPAGENIILEGEVLRAASQPLTVKMTLMQALGNAGGYKLTACLHTVVVRRSFLNAQHPDVFRVNLRSYADVDEELFLLPNDHIIVQKNWFILVREYVDEYVWGFLPPFFRTIPFAATAL